MVIIGCGIIDDDVLYAHGTAPGVNLDVTEMLQPQSDYWLRVHHDAIPKVMHLLMHESKLEVSQYSAWCKCLTSAAKVNERLPVAHLRCCWLPPQVPFPEEVLVTHLPLLSRGGAFDIEIRCYEILEKEDQFDVIKLKTTYPGMDTSLLRALQVLDPITEMSS